MQDTFLTTALFSDLIPTHSEVKERCINSVWWIDPKASTRHEVLCLLPLDMWFSSVASVQEGLSNSWKNKYNWHFSYIVVECTPAVFFIHIFPMCYVLAFFHDERCCCVLELSCYLSCLDQECVGHLRTEYCRTFCCIFQLYARSMELSSGSTAWFGGDFQLKRSIACLVAAFTVSMRVKDQVSIWCCLIPRFRSSCTDLAFLTFWHR